MSSAAAAARAAREAAERAAREAAARAAWEAAERAAREAAARAAREASALAAREAAAQKGKALFSAPHPPPPPKAAGLSPADLDSAQVAIAGAHDGRNARPVVEWLKAHADPPTREQFFDLMFKFGTVAGQTLGATQSLPSVDVDLLARSLDHAYREGTVTPDELRAAVGSGGRGAFFGEDHVSLAETIGRTGNPDLISLYAAREIRIVEAGPDDTARSLAVATALSSLPPADLQRFLQSERDGVRKSVGFVDAGPDARSTPALGRLLEAASRIQPPTRESVDLFATAIPRIGENVDSRQSASRFFLKDFDAVVRHFQADSAKLSLEGQQKVSVLFARTLFTEPSFAGQGDFRRELMVRLVRLGDSLDAHARENPPAISAQRDAQLLGSLVGAIEGGFHIAVDELKKRNEAVDGMVDLIFKGTDLIPAAKLPGAGILKGLTVDAIKRWVKNSLREKPRDASEALPFHAFLGERIDSVALVTIYDSARSEAFTNRGIGLVR